VCGPGTGSSRAADNPDWTEPGLYTVAPGVHRIPLPLPQDGLRAVNVYAIEEADRLVLVDAGWALAQSRELLVKALGTIGAELGDIDQFLVTHVHRDHYTQAITVRGEVGSRVALGKAEQISLQRMHEIEHVAFGPQLPLLVLAGAADLKNELLELGRTMPPEQVADARAGYEYPDEWLADGQDVAVGERTLRVVETPGHTRGHVVFRDEANGLLFAGDHVLPHITPSIGFEPAPQEMPLRNYLGSLQTVRELPDLRLLPAHGPVAESAHRRIDELLEHHSKRLDATQRTIREGAVTAAESANLLTWTRREKRLIDLDPMNRMLAVLETAAHLNLLVVRGVLRSETIDGVEHYAV
jgi:glyoxylase-like metal-dependent hydrolase (beta-lactamase superfamily II)